MNVKLQRPHFSQPVKATKAAMLARIEELEQQLAEERQTFGAFMDDARRQLAEEQAERRQWHENYERETQRVVELLEERGRLITAAEDKDAALGALAEATRGLVSKTSPWVGSTEDNTRCFYCGGQPGYRSILDQHTQSCPYQKAKDTLAFDFVQQAVAQYREALTTVTAEARSDSLPLLDGTVQEEEQQP